RYSRSWNRDDDFLGALLRGDVGLVPATFCELGGQSQYCRGRLRPCDKAPFGSLRTTADGCRTRISSAHRGTTSDAPGLSKEIAHPFKGGEEIPNDRVQSRQGRQNKGVLSNVRTVFLPSLAGVTCSRQ